MELTEHTGVLWAIYDSGLGQYMRESLWGYPIALTIHSIGMGLLVGVMVVVALRILGCFKRHMPFQVIKPIISLAMFGFTINLISGILLFVSDPVSYMANAAFLIKILGVVVGLLVLWVMTRTREFKVIENMGAAAVGSMNLKVLAGVSLVVWTTALTAGRLIGYMM